MPRCFVLCLILLVGMGCAIHSKEPTLVDLSLLVDLNSPKTPKHTVVLLPGALATIAIFDGALAAFGPDVKLIYYPFPGLDGRPIDPRLDISEEGKRLARFVEGHPPGHVSFVGYSTGAAIAIEAAHALSNDHYLKLALISPAAERAGGLTTTLSGVRDISTAAGRAGTFNIKTMWPEYWKLLLVGRKNYLANARIDYVQSMFAAHRDDIVLPSPELRRAHTQSLRTWQVPQGFSAHNREVAVFFGGQDPVFDVHQTRVLIAKLGGASETIYRDQGHLLPLSGDTLYQDIASYLFP